MSFLIGFGIGGALGAMFHAWVARQFPSVAGIKTAVEKDMEKL